MGQRGKVLVAGMGEIKVARMAGVLTCIGLGSCVGVLLYDPATAVASLAHVMLPESHGGSESESPGKYATTALPAMLLQMGVPAHALSRLRAVLIGGAELFANRTQTLQIGARNVEKLRSLLGAYRIPIVFEDTGGRQGRSFEFDLATGRLALRTVGGTLTVHDLSYALGMLARAS